MQDATAVTTFLFTDIEGSTRLWEQEPERMRSALARHDAIARSTVEKHRGTVVKMTGDGLHAAFDDPLDAILATLELQRALADPQNTAGIALPVRCGLHAGANERRDGDYYGTVVNRAARIMGAAHGGQMLVSQAVAERIGSRLPEGASVRELGLVRLRDLSTPERVYQIVHPALRSEFPALRSLEETPNNLPHALTTFLGRDRELAETTALLHESRLVTLVGMGGIGKSRLALHVAAESLDDWADGVWVVELGPLNDPSRVAQAVASALGAMPEPGRTLEEGLVRHLKTREVLLLLDNCEHLLESTARLAKQLLLAAPALKILATSREPLRIAGEALYTVPPLAVPGPRAAMHPDAALRSPAVALFVERAMAAHAQFRLGADNVTAVSAICHRLDGIPLALELAAARVRSMSPEQIARRLGDRFRLLTAGDPTALPRQRTLRALIDWSYELLPAAERELLRQLSVFSGGWTLEAAESVCHVRDAGEAVLELLSRLVEKSLVVMEREGERYHLLETMRQFAQERLDEAGEQEEWQRRHFEHFAALAAAAKPELVGANQAAWLARLDAERENLLAAHAWGLRGARPGRVLDMQICVKLYWINRGLLELGHRLTSEALALEPPHSRTMSRCRGLFAIGQYSSYMGRYGEARPALEEALAIARELRDEHTTAIVLQMLGMASHGGGDFAAARAYLEEGYGLARRRGDPRALASAANELAQLHRVEGQMEAARPLYQEMLQIARQIQDAETIAVGLLNLAMLEITDGNVKPVAALLLEALEIAAALRSRRMTQSVLEVCAGLAAALREWSHAARFFGAAETQAGNTGLRREPADEAFLAPLMSIAQQAAGDAVFAAEEQAGRALNHAEAMERASRWLRERSGAAVKAPERQPTG